jgi:hypothetical protein
MFAIIASLCKTVFYAFLIHDHLKTKHSDKYNEFLLHATYKLIHFYSKCQILINKGGTHLNKKAEHILKNYPELQSKIKQYITKHKPPKDLYTFEYIFNGKQIHVESNSNLNSDNNTGRDHQVSIPEKYDFIVVTENTHAPETPFLNKRLLTKIEDWDYRVEPSEIQFILVEAIFSGKRIKVDFKTDKYNFYIANNVLDEKFMKYFLLNYYDHEIKEEWSNDVCKDMVISIIDQNIKQFEFSIRGDYIHITKTNYFRKLDIIAEE